MPEEGAAAALQQRRVLWHCRRGMKELDELLGRFARERYPDAQPQERAAFEALLDLTDPQIADFLLGYQTPAEPALAAIVKAVLRR